MLTRIDAKAMIHTNTRTVYWMTSAQYTATADRDFLARADVAIVRDNASDDELLELMSQEAVGEVTTSGRPTR